jgi:hypothetical protein
VARKLEADLWIPAENGVRRIRAELGVLLPDATHSISDVTTKPSWATDTSTDNVH